MRQKNQVIAPKVRRLERTFDEFLCFAFALIVLSVFSFFLLIGHGFNLLLSEPEQPQASNGDEKSHIGLRLEQGQFQTSFNERSLWDFSFLEQESKPQSKTPQPVSPSSKPRAWQAQAVQSPELTKRRTPMARRVYRISSGSSWQRIALF